MTTAPLFFLFFFQNDSSAREPDVTDWPPLVTNDVTIAAGAPATDQPETALDLVASLLLGIFLAVIIFLSVAGNLLVCIAVYTERTLRKVGNLFIVSLAISDLFVACLVMVFAVANDLQGFWIFGRRFCDIWVAFDVMCCTASILNLCAISMDRYIHIKDPLRYGRWMTKRVIYGSIAAIWCLAALISFLPVSMDLHKPHGDVASDDDSLLFSTPAAASLQDESKEQDLFFFGSSTHEPPSVTVMADGLLPQCALDLTPTYAIVSSCISFYLPCLVMLAIYSRLFFYARMHVQNIKAVTRPVILLGRFEPAPGTEDGTADCPATTEQAPPKKGKRRSSPGANNYHVSDHKAAVTLGIIMGVFLICWVPFFCVNIVAAFCKTCIPPIVFKFLTWLGYSNSAFNPIIYSIFNLEFRLAFQKILTSQRCCGCRDTTGRGNTRNGQAGNVHAGDGNQSHRLTPGGSNTTLIAVQHPHQPLHMEPLCTNGRSGNHHHLFDQQDSQSELMLEPDERGRAKRTHLAVQKTFLVAERVV